MIHFENRNRVEGQLHESCTVDQAIEKLLNPLPRRKRKFVQGAYIYTKKTGRPFFTPYGLINPLKLDISNVKINREGN